MPAFTRRLLTFTISALVLGYLFFFFLSILSFPSDELLPQFRVSWTFEQSLRQLIVHMPTIAASAVIAAFATIVQTQSSVMSSESLVTIVGRLMIVFLLFTLVYSALEIGLLPKLHQDRYHKYYLSSLADSYLQHGRAAEEEGRNEAALEFYRDYLTIIETNPTIKRKTELLEGKIEVAKGEEKREEPAEPTVSRHERYNNLTAPELVEQSRRALEEEEDPFTAHFLAQIALELDKSREDAKRLAARAWEAIGEMEPDREERRAHSIYERKVRGYRALQQGNPVQSYYIFLELSREVPDDPDVREYLQESRAAARKQTYFIDEAEETDTMPGLRTVVYLEPRGEGAERADRGEDERRTFVYIDKMVRDGAEAWLHNVELLSFTAGGSFLRHISAPYAKLSPRISDAGEPYSILLLRGIDRHQRDNAIEPAISEGSAAATAAESGAQPLSEAELTHIYRSAVSVADLSRMSMHRDFLSRLNLIDLFTLERTFETYRHPRSYIQLAALMRLLSPFVLLVTALFAVGLGLRFRPRSQKLPVLLLPFLALLPFLVHRLISIYEYGHRLLFAGALRVAGFSLSLIVLLVLEAILMFIAIYFIARYRET